VTAASGEQRAPGQLAEAYLGALARADLAAMLALFSEDALVHSPLYGPTPARQFYPALFGDTSQSLLTLLGVTHGVKADGTPLVGIWFHFDWRLPSGRPAPFDVVDVMELSADGSVAALHIVYDTVAVRPAFEQDTGKLSWPGDGPAGPAGGQQA
jgi:ketosteroid isomerase-like protein